MKVKANEASKAPTGTVKSVIESYLTSKLSKKNLAFGLSIQRRLFSTASNILDGRNLNTKTKNLEKLVFLKENLKLKLRNFSLDW